MIVPGGARVRVDDANKREYVERFCRRRLTRGADDAIRALGRGLVDVVPAHWLQIMANEELAVCVSGERKIDVAALRRHCAYERGFSATHPTVEAFWEVGAALTAGGRAESASR